MQVVNFQSALPHKWPIVLADVAPSSYSFSDSLLQLVDMRKNFLQFSFRKFPGLLNVPLWGHKQMALHKTRVAKNDPNAIGFLQSASLKFIGFTKRTITHMTNYRTISRNEFDDHALGRLRRTEHQNNEGNEQNKKSQAIFPGTFYLCYRVNFQMVTSRGIEPRLQG